MRGGAHGNDFGKFHVHHFSLGVILCRGVNSTFSRGRPRKNCDTRISPTEKAAIVNAAQAVLPANSRVLLFGSRTDDHRRGGDIDLLVAPHAPVSAQQALARSTQLAARLSADGRAAHRHPGGACRPARRPIGVRRGAPRRARNGEDMNGPVNEAHLASAAWECERHRAALDAALAEWHAGQTPSSAQLDADAGLRRLTDQILYRFTKLQDSMGERLIPATLGWLQELHEAWPMRDRLNRFEMLGCLDVDRWLQWRDVRNRLVQEYPDAADLRHAAVFAAIAAAGAMLRDWAH